MSQETTVHTFQTPNPVDLKVELSAGDIQLSTSDATETTVELTPIHDDAYAKELIENARVEQRGDTVNVLLPRAKGSFFGRRGEVRAVISLPNESGMRIETASADIAATGRFGLTQISTGSGDVEIDQVASADVKVGSGDTEIHRALGPVKVKAGSGDVELGPVDGDVDVIVGSGDAVVESVGGRAKVKSGSGDVVVREGGDKVDVLSGSGDILIRRVDHGQVGVKTGSGDVTVGVAEGTAAYLDIQTITGDVRSALDSTGSPSDGDPTVSLSVITATGDVVLQRA